MTVYKRVGTKNLQIDVTDKNGRRIRKSSGTTDWADARQQEAQLVLQLGGPIFDIQPAPKNLTVQELIDRFLDYQRGLGKRSLNSYFVDQCKQFVRWSGPERSITEITLADMQVFQAKRMSDTSPSNANRAIQCIRRMFRLAIRWGLLTSDPCANLERFREPGGKERFLTAEEQAILLNTATEPLRCLTFVALRTGMRRGELLGIRKRDCDFLRSLVSIPMSKSGFPRRIPVLPVVREKLAGLAETLGQDDKLFRSSLGRPWSVAGMQSAFSKTVKQSGLKHLRFHDLRHTFASDALASGMQLAVLRDLMGHRTVKTTERYAHLADTQVRDALGALGAHLASQSKTVAAQPDLPGETT